ncbi:MAG: UbiA family prenyltransferase [Pseudomonadota bacterium]
MESNVLRSTRSGVLVDYIRIARFDHWFKNLFVLPGTALAVVLGNVPVASVLWPTVLALLATGFIASANYTINEWLDAESDAKHPLKKNRPGACGRLKTHWVLLQYGSFAALGLSISLLLTRPFMVVAASLLVMGLLYNVRPFRTKDKAILDVVSESVNNPIRLLLGWSAIITTAVPPSSILLAYWAGGAFLMSIKRYAEYRHIANPSLAAQYRDSFAWYTERRLLLLSFFCALCSAFFLGIFLIKYRIEFLISFPFLALLFVWYFAIGMRPDSTAQRPEHLYKNRGFTAYVTFLVCLVALLFWVDLPFLYVLMEEVQF